MSFLPSEMEDRMYELEDILAYGQIKNHHLREIFDIYNTACLLAEEMREDKIFKKYIKKMQDVFMNENVLKILPQMKLESPMTLSAEEKKRKVDKIKNLLNQRKLLNTQATRTTQKLMSNLSAYDLKTNDIIQTEIASQREIFNKKLEEKRVIKHPHKKIKNKLKESKTISISNTININKNEDKNPQPNEDNKFNTLMMGKSRQKPKFVKRRQASVIYENKYEGKLEDLLIGLWNICGNITKEATIDKMESVYVSMSEKYLKEAMSIILKYNNELKDIDEGDLDDTNNVNVIIYNQLVNDRDNELTELKERMNKEKKEKLDKIRDEQFGLYDKVREISKVKIDVLHELIKTKLPEPKKDNNNLIKEEEIKDNHEEKKGGIIIDDDDDDVKHNERLSRLSINEVKNADNAELRVSVLWNN